MHPAYASNASTRTNRPGNTQPYPPPALVPGHPLAGHALPARHSDGHDIGTEIRTGARLPARHDLRRSMDNLLGARLAPRRAIATSREAGTSDMSGVADTSGMSSETSSRREHPRRTSHAASNTVPHSAPHAAPHSASYSAPHSAPHSTTRSGAHADSRTVSSQLARVETAPRLRERLLSEHSSTSLRTSHARRPSPSAPTLSDNADISSPQRYRALSERCAMMIVANQARQHQYSAPALASALSNLARVLQDNAPHTQHVDALRDFTTYHSARSNTPEQPRAIARGLMADYLAARFLSDPVSTTETLAVEMGERRTELEQQLRMSTVYILLQTLQHCLNLHGHVQQLREKCAVAFLHVYVARQHAPSTGTLAAMSYAAVHEEILLYQGFVFGRDAIASATPQSLIAMRMMGDIDDPLHLGGRAANVRQLPPLQAPARLHPGSTMPSRPHHILSHKLTAQIFKMYAKRTGLVMLGNKMGDPASPLETRLTYLQGFLGSVLPDAGQRVPTLIRIYAGLRYFSDPLCTPRVIAQELGCEESMAQASLDAMHEFRQLRDLSGLWNTPEDRMMLRERCAQSLLNAACDTQISNERMIHPDVPGSAYIIETTLLYRALNNVLRGELCFRDRQRQVIDYTTAHFPQRR